MNFCCSHCYTLYRRIQHIFDENAVVEFLDQWALL